jgi:hypothetical protein
MERFDLEVTEDSFVNITGRTVSEFRGVSETSAAESLSESIEPSECLVAGFNDFWLLRCRKLGGGRRRKIRRVPETMIKFPRIS